MTTIKYKKGGAWFDLLPNPLPGFIYPFGGGTVPQGFLLCNGQAVSRTTYAELFAVVGTIYGGGDGSTTFNVPDLRGRVGIGASSGHALGSTGGKESVNLSACIGATDSNIGALGYIGEGWTAYQGAHNPTYTVTGSAYGGGSWNHSTPVTESSVNSRSTSIMQPYNTINYIISTGQNTGVSVEDIITGVTTLPLEVQYGGTGATNVQQFGLNFGLAFYPVGSIFCSVNNTSPSQLFGGTWAALESRMLIGAGSGYAVNATGGTTTVSISGRQLPVHQHLIPVGFDDKGYWYGTFNSNNDCYFGSAVWGSVYRDRVEKAYTTLATNSARLAYTDNQVINDFTGEPHENMPPYLAVYMWKRTA